MKETILVTGGAGYIGSHTIIELLEKTNYHVISADCYINSSKLTFERIEKITGAKIKNYNTNLCDINATETIFKENNNIVGIIHFAALKSVPESVENPELYYKNNNESLITILNCAKKYNVPNVIFSSSCSVYGNVAQLPVNESTPFSRPESPYAHTKQMGEDICKKFASENAAIKIIALRYFNPVGAHPSGLIGEDPLKPINNLIPAITKFAIGINKKLEVFGTDYKTRDGSCIRDYIHVCDIANAHVKALTYAASLLNENYDVFNLGTGDGVSVKEAIQSFEKVSGLKLNVTYSQKREGDVEAIYSDSSKAHTKLGWKTEYNIEQMMETAWRWENNNYK